MKIKLSKYYLDKCTEFAHSQIEGSKQLYAYRGEHNINKMIDDIIVGKAGECAVHRYLTDKGMYCTRPDFKIYKAKRKSYDADLYCEDLTVHVKSQSVLSSKRYGSSWLFQRRDNLLNTEDRKEFMAFTKVNGREVDILGVVRAIDIQDLFGECSVPRYRATKVALYWDEVKENLPYYKLKRL